MPSSSVQTAIQIKYPLSVYLKIRKLLEEGELDGRLSEVRIRFLMLCHLNSIVITSHYILCA
jgi:hypothetical protein